VLLSLCMEAVEVLRPISDLKGSKIGGTGAVMVGVWAERVRRVVNAVRACILMRWRVLG